MSTSIQFLGATRTVTGSKHVINHRGKVVMLDCGMFQGLKKWRLKNWEAFPLVIGYVDDIVLSHAHIDHSGYLPRFVRYGFDGRIFATPTTADLCGIMLPDSAHIQEEDARYANKMGFTKHRPALPLYTADDAQAALEQFQVVPYGEAFDINRNVRFQFLDAGHIMGSAIVRITLTREDDSRITLVYSGDLGRFGEHILRDPSVVRETDFLILESTYGDRLHEHGNVEDRLAQIITETIARGGVVLIPSFAVGRTQEVLYHLRVLQEQKRIPLIPVYLDSPLAIKATKIFCQHTDNLPTRITRAADADECPLLCHNLHLASRKEESIYLNTIDHPAIIISASGMCEAGRILHHLKFKLPDHRNSVVFVGYQAEGTRGRRILEGEREIKIHGQLVPVRAAIHEIGSFSAHADANEIMRWLSGFEHPPRMTFLVHGEPEGMNTLAGHIKEKLGWSTMIPDYLDKVDLDALMPPLGAPGDGAS